MNEKKSNMYGYIKFEKKLTATDGIFQNLSGKDEIYECLSNNICDLVINHDNNMLVSHDGKLDMLDKNGVFLKRIDGNKDKYSPPIDAGLVKTDSKNRIIIQNNAKICILDSTGKFITEFDPCKYLKKDYRNQDLTSIHITDQDNILIEFSYSDSPKSYVFADSSGNIISSLENVRGKYLGHNIVIEERSRYRNLYHDDHKHHHVVLYDFSLNDHENDTPRKIKIESGFMYSPVFILSRDGKRLLVSDDVDEDHSNDSFFYDLHTNKKITCEDKSCLFYKENKFNGSFINNVKNMWNCRHMEQFKHVHNRKKFLYWFDDRSHLNIFDGKENWRCSYSKYMIRSNNQFIICKYSDHEWCKLILSNSKVQLNPIHFYSDHCYRLETKIDSKDRIVIRYGDAIKILNPDGTILKTFKKDGEYCGTYNDEETDGETDAEPKLYDSRGRLIERNHHGGIDIVHSSGDIVKSIVECGKYGETLSIADAHTIDKWDNIIIVSTFRLTIRIYNPHGNLIKSISGTGAGASPFSIIYSVASDSKERIIIAGVGGDGNMIQIFGSSKKSNHNSRGKWPEDPFHILRVRYAKGELTDKEFESMKRKLK